MKRAEKELEAMRDKVENIVDARQGFTQNLSISSFMKVAALRICSLTMKKISTLNISLRNKKTIQI